VALEHARAIGSKALGQAQAIMTSVHNTPFGDIVDTEDDLQPLVFSMFRDATRTVKLVAAAMRTAEFDAARLEARAAEGWTTLTELADTLVRDHGIPFRSAHAVAGRLIAARQRDAVASLSSLLAETTAELLGARLQYSETALARILSPRHFVDVRRTHGGPAPEETARAAAVARALLEEDQTWWTNTTDALTAAEQRLTDRAARL
jgi:argininosuccinate lyase